MKLNKVFLSWLAGFWEGEGCIAHFKNGTFRVEITQSIDINKTTLDTMKLIQTHFKGSVREYRPKILHHLNGIKWSLNNHTDMLYFLNQIVPYCQLRKQFVLNSIEQIKMKQYKHYREYIPYLNKIKIYLNRDYSYRIISKKLKKYIAISPPTICRLVKKYGLRYSVT